MTTMETGTPEQTSLPNGSLHHLLEAAWAGEDQIQPKACSWRRVVEKMVVVVVVVVELVREIKDTASVPRVQEPGAQVAIPWPVV